MRATARVSGQRQRPGGAGHVDPRGGASAESQRLAIQYFSTGPGMISGHTGTMRYEAGQTVNDKYEILESLGHGGMNDAYKARERESGCLVVLKIPFASLIGDPATFSRYQRELEIGKRLHHPNIQPLLEDGRLDGGVTPYLA